MQHGNDINDQELISRCRDGDDHAFEILYHRYRLQLYAYINKFISDNQTLVDEIFQQAWIKASQNLNKYDHRQKFLAWICRIAHNALMDHFRDTAKRKSEELTDDIGIADHESAYELYDRDAFENALENAIDGLPKDQQVVVEMRRQGLSFKEISEKLGVNMNTLLGRMHYAVNRLKEELKDFVD